jgi:hypothetical protein
MIFLQLSILLNAFSVLKADVCEPGTVVYAPFPGIGVMVQAIAVSRVIEGSFIVQWSGSPDLCINPSNRAKCVVDATESYNGQVCDINAPSKI